MNIVPDLRVVPALCGIIILISGGDTGALLLENWSYQFSIIWDVQEDKLSFDLR